LRRWLRSSSLPLAGGSAALLLILAGLALLANNERLYQAQRVTEASVQARTLAASVVAAVDFDDREAGQKAVEAIGLNPQIRFATVFDRQGRQFARFHRESAAPGAVIGRAPVMADGERIGTVAIGTVRETLFRKLTRFSMLTLFVLLAAAIAVILGSATKALRRANRELGFRAEALAESNRKLGEEMEERARAEEQLRQAHKMQALGQLTGGIAHDFNNLLTVIQGSADILRQPGLSDAKRERYTTAISETAGRAASLTSQLLSFARRQPLRPRLLDLHAQIEGMADLLDRSLGERVAVRLTLSETPCGVWVDPVQLENAVLNVAVNARDAMPNGGTLTVATRHDPHALDGDPAVELSIADTGEGIDPDTLARVFEPFFTTKEVGRGTGLGLSQVYGFAAQSGGRVVIDSRPGEGTTVRLLLPCADLDAVTEAAAPAQPAPAAPASRILVVDDNESVGAFAEALLGELGHSVVRARDGVEALALLETREVDAVFSDVVMPGMSGVELAELIAERHPGLPVVLTTGFSDEEATARARDLPMLFKPYSLGGVARALNQVLAPAH
jgi:signal transduction histidine kinase/CheY-like chemotaxis protein